MLEHPSVQQHPSLSLPDEMEVPLCPTVGAALALVPRRSYLSRSSLAIDSVVTEGSQSLERHMVIVSVSEGEEKKAVASEVEGHHSLETPGWETGKDQEARKVGDNAAGVVFAPSW